MTFTRNNDAYAWTGPSTGSGGNGSTATVTNGLNQLVTVGGVAADYSPKGDLTKDPTTRKIYAYTADSRLSTVDSGTANFTDDALVRLYAITTATGGTRFAYDGTKR